MAITASGRCGGASVVVAVARILSKAVRHSRWRRASRGFDGMGSQGHPVGINREAGDNNQLG